jgi:hypothetical protein
MCISMNIFSESGSAQIYGCLVAKSMCWSQLVYYDEYCDDVDCGPKIFLCVGLMHVYFYEYFYWIWECPNIWLFGSKINVLEPTRVLWWVLWWCWLWSQNIPMGWINACVFLWIFLMNLGVPKYMVVWKQNQCVGANSCIMMSIVMMLIVVPKYSYGLD